ncbi:unnamed protein product, partial [Caretta caretta]
MNPDCPRDGPQLSHGTNPGYDEDGSGILDRANEDWRHRTTGTLEHTGTLEQDAMIISHLPTYQRCGSWSFVVMYWAEEEMQLQT